MNVRILTQMVSNMIQDLILGYLSQEIHASKHNYVVKIIKIKLIRNQKTVTLIQPSQYINTNWDVRRCVDVKFYVQLCEQ